MLFRSRGVGEEAVPVERAGTGLWRFPAFRGGMLAMALYIAAEVGPAVWLPTWFRERFGASAVLGSASVAVFWAAMMLGRLRLGRRVDGPGARRFVARLAVLAACAWTAVLLSVHAWMALAAVAAFGLAMSVCAPALQGFAARPFPGSETPVMAWLAAVSGAIGALLPWGIGAAAERLGPAGAVTGRGMGLTFALGLGPLLLAALALVVSRAGGLTEPGAGCRRT